MSNDVRRAYFYAPATRPIYVELPEEAGEGPGKSARLLKSLYGTRDAATNWSQACSQILLDMGFEQGVSTPCLFFNRAKKICTVVHGDDFLSSGSSMSLGWMQAPLAKVLDTKPEKFGADEEKKQMTFPTRIIT